MPEDVASSLPQVTLLPGSTVTVIALGAGAEVKLMNIKLFQVKVNPTPASPQPILLPRGD